MIHPPQTSRSDRELRTELEEAQGEVKRTRAEAEALRPALEASQAEVDRQRALLPPNDGVEALAAALRASTEEAERLQHELTRVEGELARANAARALVEPRPDPGLIRSVEQSQQELRSLKQRLEGQGRSRGGGSSGLGKSAHFLAGFVMVSLGALFIVNGTGSGGDFFWCTGLVLAGGLMALRAGSSDD